MAWNWLGQVNDESHCRMWTEQRWSLQGFGSDAPASYISWRSWTSNTMDIFRSREHTLHNNSKACCVFLGCAALVQSSIAPETCTDRWMRPCHWSLHMKQELESGTALRSRVCETLTRIDSLCPLPWCTGLENALVVPGVGDATTRGLQTAHASLSTIHHMATLHTAVQWDRKTVCRLV